MTDPMNAEAEARMMTEWLHTRTAERNAALSKIDEMRTMLDEAAEREDDLREEIVLLRRLIKAKDERAALGGVERDE